MGGSDMRAKDTTPPFVDPTSIVLTVPKEDTVWLGNAQRGIVTKVAGDSVWFQSIFDDKLEVRRFDKKSFCSTYHHTPKVSADSVRAIFRHYIEVAEASDGACATSSACSTASQEEPTMTMQQSNETFNTEEVLEDQAAASAEQSKRRGRKSAFEPQMKITVLVDKNPKRGKAAERFNLYATNDTVEKYLAAGGLLADLRWDSKQGWIKVE